MSEVSEKLQGVIDTVKELSVVELVQLVDALKRALGLTDDDLRGGGGAVVMQGGPGADAAADDAPTEFNVILKTDGGNKIQAIKVVRAITGLGLADAKKAVEGIPYTVKEAASKEEADELKKQFDEIGAEVELKGV